MGYAATLDQCARSPAAAIHNLLVGEHGLVDGIPIHFGFFFIDQAFFKQAREEPLFPAVVVTVTGGNLATPVIGEAQTLQLLAHVVDIVIGPFCRRGLVLHGGIFCGQSKCIPAHGLQHILALHALVAGYSIADRVIADVTHVQIAAGVGKHRQAIKLLPGRIFGHNETVVLSPVALDTGFDLLG